MKLILITLFVLLVYMGVHGQSVRGPLRAELLEMVKIDQDARIKCTNGTGDEQTQCLATSAKKVEKEGFSAFMLVL